MQYVEWAEEQKARVLHIFLISFEFLANLMVSFGR